MSNWRPCTSCPYFNTSRLALKIFSSHISNVYQMYIFQMFYKCFTNLFQMYCKLFFLCNRDKLIHSLATFPPINISLVTKKVIVGDKGDVYRWEGSKRVYEFISVTKKKKFAIHLKKICKTFVKHLKYIHLIYI
jgi:hypothetical protein